MFRKEYANFFDIFVEQNNQYSELYSTHYSVKYMVIYSLH